MNEGNVREEMSEKPHSSRKDDERDGHGAVERPLLKATSHQV